MNNTVSTVGVIRVRDKKTGEYIQVAALQGMPGRGILSIDLTASVGNVDTYTIFYTDGTSTSFNITNAVDIPKCVVGISEKTIDEQGLSSYTFELSDDTTTTIKLNDTTLPRKYQYLEDTSIEMTPEDNTEYWYPNATSVTITCPEWDKDNHYECWIRIGNGVDVIKGFSISIENAVLLGNLTADWDNILAVEISIKDGFYLVATKNKEQ